MSTARSSIISINAGSSSIKLDVFSTASDRAPTTRVATVRLSNIGQADSELFVQQTGQQPQIEKRPVADLLEAVAIISDWISDALPPESIVALGYRIVHGGPNNASAALVTESLLSELRSLATLDPEHAPTTLQLIDDMRQRYPSAQHVACFDTAFFHQLPQVAQLLPLPRKFGLRRYGFHGLSYTYLQSAFRDMAGDTAVNGRVIYAHLGNGVSLAATNHGKPVDTTMGFSPSSGMLMSSRSGDLDPNIMTYLQATTDMTVSDYAHMVNFESGLLGVSELSSAMRTLLEHEHTHQKASEAVELFVYRLRKSIAELTATIGGLDSLVFSGGIGEQSAAIRERACDGLSYLGITLDHEQNRQHAGLISSSSSKVGVHVIATDEAQVIIDQVLQTITSTH